MTESLRALLWTAVSSEKQADDDKLSLTEQERACRDWCKANGYEVVGVLTVPGESRSETDVLTIFEEFAEKQVFAYHDLRRMWQPPRQFDVLVAYHDSRLGRSEALFAYVISNVMKSGAKIYTILGGWYEPSEYQMKMFMGMASVSNEMKRFVALTKAVKLDKASKGTLVHSVPCWAFKVERNEKGEVIGKVRDESKRTVIEAAVQLVLEGCGWSTLERELFERNDFGRNGKPFTRYTFYWLFHNPNFHGNEFIGRVTGRNDRKKGFTDLWVFDPSYPPPNDAKVFYGVIPAFLDPPLDEALKSELRRRKHAVRGSTHPRRAHMFTGVLTCYYCGRNLSFFPANKHRHLYWQCQSKFTSIKDDKCLKNRMIKEEVVKAWLDVELRAAIQANDPEYFLHRADEPSQAARLAQLESNRKTVDQQLDRAMDEAERATGDKMRQRWRDRGSEYMAELEEIDRQIANLENRQSNDVTGARHAYEQLIAYGDMDDFWADGENIINQILHGLLGDRAIVVRDKTIWGRGERTR